MFPLVLWVYWISPIRTPICGERTRCPRAYEICPRSLTEQCVERRIKPLPSNICSCSLSPQCHPLGDGWSHLWVTDSESNSMPVPIFLDATESSNVIYIRLHCGRVEIRSCQMKLSFHCTNLISNIWFISNIISAVFMSFCRLYIPGQGWGPLVGMGVGNGNLLTGPAQIPTSPTPSLQWWIGCRITCLRACWGKSSDPFDFLNLEKERHRN